MRWGTKLAAMLICALFVLPATAAAAPTNDDFADREVLNGTLPIVKTQSNEGATQESGEDISFSASGHSVWFEWETPATEWITIGTCGSDFRTVIGIFVGTQLETLAKAAAGNPAEGPNCHGEREFTFKAKAGVDYTIAVDGNTFFLPGSPPPIVEGTIELRIESTSPPANDDFADAADLTAAGKIYELESSEPFYFARLESHNWTATKEAGEPEHEGAPGGASVWYEWTAPATGLMRMTACCFALPAVGLYTGDSLETLVSVPTEMEFWPEKRAQVIEGETYRIAVDGHLDEATGEPAQVWHSVNVMMNLPPFPQPPVPSVLEVPQPDTTPPETLISKRRVGRSTAKFWFGSSEPGSTFRCGFDGRPFKPCGSGRAFKKLLPGRHKLRVYAVDPAGNADPTPAVVRFRAHQPPPAK